MRRDTKIQCREYLDFVKSKGCMISHEHFGPVDPHHLIATGQRKSKQNDFTAVNLCRGAHGEIEQGGVEKFEEKYQVNVWREAAWLMVEYLVYGRVVCKDERRDKVEVDGIKGMI